MTEERHIVRQAEKGIFRRNPRLVAVEQIEAADIQRRRVQGSQRIEVLIAALLQDDAEMRRHGDPALGVDPIDRMREKPVHYPLRPPCPVFLHCPRRMVLRMLLLRFRRAQANPSARQCPHGQSSPNTARKRSIDWVDGIPWATMGVNGINTWLLCLCALRAHTSASSHVYRSLSLMIRYLAQQQVGRIDFIPRGIVAIEMRWNQLARCGFPRRRIFTVRLSTRRHVPSG